MTVTAERAAPRRVRPRRFGLLRHSLALGRRSLLKTLRTPEQLIDVTVQPLMFLVIFVFLLGGAVSGSTGAYLQFILPAMLAQVMLVASMSTGVNLNTDIDKGVFDRFRSLPIGRSAPLIGSVLGDFIRYLVATASMMGFGYLLGFRATNGFFAALAACVLTMVFSFCVSWVFVLFGMLARSPGSVQGLAFLVIFPLTFGTSMTAPKGTMPGWLQTWLNINPVERVMDANRALMLGGDATGPVLASLAWGAGFLLVFAPLAVRAYRRRA
ncbi:ABC transporter permease [Nonomuraea sp. NBC_01738]|uniref:ABC transporter permease n=1 Tax=Nonomuraea sp. NBC_01738 TaxID=2976003 RepID=UPI002E0FD5B5|nr:ABC transporter permease [Nonomuraea sp. NBC_01738]